MNLVVIMLGKVFGMIEGIVEMFDLILLMMDVVWLFVCKYICENFNWCNELEDGMLVSF